jgi:hypothetical protein
MLRPAMVAPTPIPAAALVESPWEGVLFVVDGEAVVLEKVDEVEGVVEVLEELLVDWFEKDEIDISDGLEEDVKVGGICI